MVYTFQGGIHIGTKKEAEFKAATSAGPIESLPAPQQVILPVSMHIGAPAKPVVAVGDTVFVGQVVAEGDGPVSAPVHASISGKVTEIAPHLHPNGAEILSIVIENDGLNRVHESVHPYAFDQLTNEQRIELIRSAGLVGLGGAAFPTHVKIQSGVGKCDTILINGAECEPYITADHRTLLERAADIVGGAKMLADIMDVQRVIIAIEDNKRDTFGHIEPLFAEDDRLSLYAMQSKYPQGGEKMLIKACTGREVPTGKLPADVGCAVFNVDTAGAIYRRFTTGMPVVRRTVTVAGSAIAQPKNLDVCIGTPAESLIDACGGFSQPPTRLMTGGPMMGVSQTSLDFPIVKGTNAVIALCGSENLRAEESACIRCGRCVTACPVQLMPLTLYAQYRADRQAQYEKTGMMDCIECGACSYVCPARIELVQHFRAAKVKIAEARIAMQSASDEAPQSGADIN